jgi:hypothetical protein
MWCWLYILYYILDILTWLKRRRCAYKYFQHQKHVKESKFFYGQASNLSKLNKRFWTLFHVFFFISNDAAWFDGYGWRRGAPDRRWGEWLWRCRVFAALLCARSWILNRPGVAARPVPLVSMEGYSEAFTAYTILHDRPHSQSGTTNISIVK